MSADWAGRASGKKKGSLAQQNQQLNQNVATLCTVITQARKRNKTGKQLFLQELKFRKSLGIFIPGWV